MTRNLSFPESSVPFSAAVALRELSSYSVELGLVTASTSKAYVYHHVIIPKIIPEGENSPEFSKLLSR